jgi:hypothetical protein
LAAPALNDVARIVVLANRDSILGFQFAERLFPCDLTQGVAVDSRPAWRVLSQHHRNIIAVWEPF